MANFLFKDSEEDIKNGVIDLLQDNISVVLLGNDPDKDAFTPVKSNQFLSDVPQENIITKPISLQNKSFKNLVFDAADIKFISVRYGSAVSGVLIYAKADSPESSRLISYIVSAVNLDNMRTNGGDIIVTWDDGTNKIFKVE